MSIAVEKNMAICVGQEGGKRINVQREGRRMWRLAKRVKEGEE